MSERFQNQYSEQSPSPEGFISDITNLGPEISDRPEDIADVVIDEELTAKYGGIPVNIAAKPKTRPFDRYIKLRDNVIGHAFPRSPLMDDKGLFGGTYGVRDPRYGGTINGTIKSVFSDGSFRVEAVQTRVDRMFYLLFREDTSSSYRVHPVDTQTRQPIIHVEF